MSARSQAGDRADGRNRLELATALVDGQEADALRTRRSLILCLDDPL